MGSLRLFFAILVIGVHSSFGSGGSLAVPSFYILSGFYMALILSKKYIGKNSSYRLFITNRFLRIYPLYFVILLLTFLLSVANFVLNPGSDNIISQIIRIAQGSVFEFANFVLRNITLILSFDYVFPIDASIAYLIIQQASTLQMELLFYLLVPFIVGLQRKKFYTLLFIYAIYFLVSSYMGISYPVLWWYFVQNLVYFLLGILSFKLYERLSKQMLPDRRKRLFTVGFLIFTIIYTFGLGSVGGETVIYHWLYYVLLVFSVPLMFQFKEKLDVYFGKLSYSVYLSHFIFIKLIERFFEVSNFTLFVFATIATLIFSVILAQFLEKPIDAFRQRRLKT